ncbi:MAG: DUF4270 family protein [Chitinophagales bacterium]
MDKDLLNNGDNPNLKKDTIYAKVSSLFEQPVNAYNIGTGMVGNITDDPNFGNTYAGFYAQCRISSNNVSFGTNPVLDSAVLTLRYSGSYGKFTQPIDLLVYELNQAILDSVKYRSIDAFQVYPAPIGEIQNFIPNTTDSVLVDTVKLAPHLRVPLTNTFGNKILNAPSSQLVDLTSFLNLFRGFYITSSPSAAGNGIVYLDIRSAISGINLYYHNSDDTLAHTYLIPASGVTVSHIDNNYSGKPAAAAINNPNPNGDAKMFVQGGAGTFGKIEFPDILDSLEDGIAINKAELILTQSVPDTGYLAPLVLDLFRINDAGQSEDLSDAGLSYFGGVRVTETVNGKTVTRYHFVITRYLQKLIEKQLRNNGLYLKTVSPSGNTERVVITNDATDADLRVTLLVKYTKLP